MKHKRAFANPLAPCLFTLFLSAATLIRADVIKRANLPTPESGGTNCLGWLERSHHGGSLSPLVATAWVNANEGPVTRMRWWGGYEGWTGTTPPPAAPTLFRLHMWSHNTNSALLPFAQPLTVLWTASVTTASVTYETGNRDPRAAPTTNSIFRYDAVLPTNAVFTPESTPGQTYWLSIGAVDTNVSPAHPWGWLLRFHVGQPGPDRAVLITAPSAPVIGDSFSLGSAEADQDPWDSAFVLYLTAPSTNDFGDAPEAYGTTLLANGARHTVGSPLALGGLPDAEDDGFPSAGANGDDLSASDDENGVTFGSALIPGATLAAVANASVAGGRLNAWLDFDQNGNWTDPNDHVVTDMPLAAGPNPLSISVPVNVSNGVVYARFRLSTQPGLGTSGLAPDGEVEDYAISVGGLDFGDAPDSFPTLRSSDGARHVTPSALWMGGIPDAETDAHSSSSAEGDDLAGTDDEDGAAFPAALTPGSITSLFVTASTSGLVSAWIDFDGSGSWNSTSERIATNSAVSTGVNTIRFAVPSTAPATSVVARVRIATAPMAGPGGEAADGEVEDYTVVIAGLDFGDAPPGLPVTLAANGARHVVPSPIWLGSAPDVDTNGQSSVNADGDDLAGRDDEDGVSLPGGLVVGQSNLVRVIASTPAILNAWMDLDQNGSWLGSGERIISNRAVLAGTNDLWLNLPGLSAAGALAARFRLSSLPNLDPTGLAPDGEVEDYLFNASKYDFGDAPTGFPVKVAQDGARHIAGTALWLGPVAPDGENDGLPSTQADGDDTSGTDDEDGVIFPPVMPIGGVATVTVTASSSGILNAWIDFNRDHVWSALAGEQVVSNLSVLSGARGIVVTIPPEVTPGLLAARFRISTAGDPTPTGPAVDGEVEDYLLSTSLSDLGDAPSGYPVTLAQGGARHLITSGLHLGALAPDGEMDGLPSVQADGDDTNGVDDEDGVVLPASFPVGGVVTVTVTASSSGILNAWIDFNRDYTWASPGEEQIAADLSVVTGLQQIVVSVPAHASAGSAGARFRISTATGIGPQGLAGDGEVEDYVVTVSGLDFGDAPTNYPVTIAQDGARHNLPTINWLGASFPPDAEVDGQPSAIANGDDNTGANDEDGVIWPTAVIRGETTNLAVVASGSGGVLNAWIDFNRDGTWDSPGEQIATDLSLAAGTTSLSLTVPGSVLPGPTFARFRLSTATGMGPQGPAPDGEVEDYAVTIGQHAITNQIVFTNVVVTDTVTVLGVQARDPVFYQLQSSTNPATTSQWKEASALLPGPLDSAVDTNPVDSQKIYRLAVPFVP